LAVIEMHVPPLRDRTDDVLPLAEHFLRRAAERAGRRFEGLSREASQLLLAYSWPGNVRELENVIERAVALATSSVIGLGDLPKEVGGAASQTAPSLVELPEEGCDLDAVVGEVERRLILQALDRTGGVRVAAAKLLGVTQRSLRYRMQKLGLAAAGDESEDDPESSSRVPRGTPAGT
jgi:two-component system response regulator PilR (NtrC family)